MTVDQDGRGVRDRLAAAGQARGAPLDGPRTPALANALDGMSRAHAARTAGTERKALRDAVVRFSESEEAALSACILRGSDPECGDPSNGTLPDLCRFIGNPRRLGYPDFDVKRQSCSTPGSRLSRLPCSRTRDRATSPDRRRSPG